MMGNTISSLCSCSSYYYYFLVHTSTINIHSQIFASIYPSLHSAANIKVRFCTCPFACGAV